MRKLRRAVAGRGGREALRLGSGLAGMKARLQTWFITKAVESIVWKNKDQDESRTKTAQMLQSMCQTHLEVAGPGGHDLVPDPLDAQDLRRGPILRGRLRLQTHADSIKSDAELATAEFCLGCECPKREWTNPAYRSLALQVADVRQSLSL